MKVINFADAKNGLEGLEEDIIMGIDEDNHLTLLNSLTYLYSNPVMAALREYCANASDAHKESGQTKPFDVEFPFRHNMTSNLRVRDYGSGMNREQLTKVFSQYGATTKANNNAQVGGFGLGSKSGLAVSNQLFVNSVSNGVLIKAEVLKTKDSLSKIRILSEKPTNLPSGTEIILPLTTNQLNELREKAEEELIGYHASQIKLNNEPIPYSVHDINQFIPITLGSNVLAYVALNNMHVKNSYKVGTIPPPLVTTAYSIVMGGVYYPSLPATGSLETNRLDVQNLLVNLDSRFVNSPRVILNVPVGSVDLPPHRDAIIDTEKTWASLTNLMMNVQTGLDSSVQRYLNSQSLSKASLRVASMQGLFAPTGEWEHKGKTLNNDISQVMNVKPMLYSVLESSYSTGSLRLQGGINAPIFTAIHTRTNSGEYNYTTYRGVSKKHPIAVVSISVEESKYNEVIAFDANNNAPHSKRVTLPNPRVQSYLNKYVKPVMNSLYKVESLYIIVTPANQKVVFPAHFRSAIDGFFTEDEVRTKYRALFPPKARTAVQQQHCRLTKDKWEYSLVSSHEEIVYFGGKGSYGPEDNSSIAEISALKKVSRGMESSTTKYSWIQAGLLKLIGNNDSLIAVGDTRSATLFKKSFATATPLGEIVMGYYENLDSERQLAIQHAYSIFNMWDSGTDNLLSFLGGENSSIRNNSVRLMFAEPELVSIGYYLFAFKDDYVEGFADWKKNLISEMKGKQLAGMMLLPLQSLLEQFRISEKGYMVGKVIPTRLKLRGDKSLHFDSLVEFADKLTA